MGRGSGTPVWRYQERLSVPWYWWPVSALLAAGAGLQVGAVLWAAPAWLPVAVPVAATLAALWWWGRVCLVVTDNHLQVGDARLRGEVIAQVVPLSAEERRELLGPSADPRAFVVQRPWVAGAVQVVLEDPADPTPYWLVSAAAPDALATALVALAHRTGRGQRPVADT